MLLADSDGVREPQSAGAALTLEAEPSFVTTTEGLVHTIESLVCVQRRGSFRVTVMKAAL